MAQVEINNMKERIKKLDLQNLHWLLHNMQVYNVSMDKRKQVIDEINKRENHASNK